MLIPCCDNYRLGYHCGCDPCSRCRDQAEANARELRRWQALSLTDRQVVASEFRECAACAAKPGAPLLCDSCRHNRRVIAKQDAELERLRKYRALYRHNAEATDELYHRCDTLRRLHGWLRLEASSSCALRLLEAREPWLKEK